MDRMTLTQASTRLLHKWRPCCLIWNRPDTSEKLLRHPERTHLRIMSCQNQMQSLISSRGMILTPVRLEILPKPFRKLRGATEPGPAACCSRNSGTVVNLPNCIHPAKISPRAPPPPKKKAEAKRNLISTSKSRHKSQRRRTVYSSWHRTSEAGE